MKLNFKTVAEGYTKRNSEFLKFMGSNILDDVTSHDMLDDFCYGADGFSSPTLQELAKVLYLANSKNPEVNDAMIEAFKENGMSIEDDHVKQFSEYVTAGVSRGVGVSFMTQLHVIHPSNFVLPKGWYHSLPAQVIDDLSEDYKHGIEYAKTKKLMSLKKPKLLPATTWLVHFTDDPNGICEHGFMFGAPDKEYLSLTRHLDDDDRYSENGYNFAYLASMHGLEEGKKYGNHCVLFQSSGTVTHHSGDREEQIVFDGSHVDHSGIVPIFYDRHDNKWEIINFDTKKVIFSYEDLSHVVSWAIKNRNQYKNVICPGAK